MHECLATHCFQFERLSHKTEPLGLFLRVPAAWDTTPELTHTDYMEALELSGMTPIVSCSRPPKCSCWLRRRIGKLCLLSLSTSQCSLISNSKQLQTYSYVYVTYSLVVQVPSVLSAPASCCTSPCSPRSPSCSRLWLSTHSYSQDILLLRQREIRVKPNLFSNFTTLLRGEAAWHALIELTFSPSGLLFLPIPTANVSV